MPYKSEKIKLPRELDRRVKLTDEQREDIRREYAEGAASTRTLAARYNVSRRTIQYTIHPERYERLKERFKQNRADGRYKPTKTEWAATVRDHRRYKQELYKQGRLTTEGDAEPEAEATQTRRKTNAKNR